MKLSLYNIVGTDGSWFSPYGWRVLALVRLKELDVDCVDVPIIEQKRVLEFAGGGTTPLLVAGEGDDRVFLRDSWKIARFLEETFPEPTAFPPGHMEAIQLFNRLIDRSWQLPAFIAWSPDYFSSGVISGEDDAIFRSLVERVTGGSPEDNRARQAASVADFRLRLQPLEEQLLESDWLLGPFSYADVLLLSCLKCFATVLRGIDGVLGEPDAFPGVARWYARIHDVCGIREPH